MKHPNWSLMPAIMELVGRLEHRLTKAGVHDNLRCQGLFVHLYPDGSGYLMQHYSFATKGESPDLRMLRTVMREKQSELFTFETLEQLHGELIALTMKTASGESNG